MSNGKILIGEDVAGWVGDCMSGGEIHIGGSAGHSVGRNMSGGIIRINGNVASFDETAFFAKNKGTIIWKGETIWKDGSYTVAGLNIRLNPFAKNKIKIENE
jgi:formylmethanofuran dehydrogenase subunit C